MKKKAKYPFDKSASAFDLMLIRSYKIAKKTLKYSLYITVLYFAYEGFMGWE